MHMSEAWLVQVAVLQSAGREGSDDESWGDELEKELEGGPEATVSFPPLQELGQIALVACRKCH